MSPKDVEAALRKATQERDVAREKEGELQAQHNQVIRERDALCKQLNLVRSQLTQECRVAHAQCEGLQKDVNLAVFERDAAISDKGALEQQLEVVAAKPLQNGNRVETVQVQHAEVIDDLRREHESVVRDLQAENTQKLRAVQTQFKQAQDQHAVSLNEEQIPTRQDA
jgi:DNA integrity scanning protein DisA with diadenylate cyclase activity